MSNSADGWDLFTQVPAPAYTPYPFQAEAVEAAFAAWGKGVAAPLIEAPTGSGKSIIIAEVCRRYLSANPKGRIIKAVHRQELVQQNSEKIADMTGVDVGIYSAGLGSKRLDSPITCASIQSIARVKDWPYADLLIIDEAHRVPPVKPRRTSQYHTLIAGLRDRNSTLQILASPRPSWGFHSGPSSKR